MAEPLEVHATFGKEGSIGIEFSDEVRRLPSIFVLGLPHDVIIKKCSMSRALQIVPGLPHVSLSQGWEVKSMVEGSQAFAQASALTSALRPGQGCPPAPPRAPLRDATSAPLPPPLARASPSPSPR